MKTRKASRYFSVSKLSGMVPITLALAATHNASADIRLYDNNTTEVDLKAQVQAATFDNNNSWWGASTDFLGENTDNWSEVAAEIGLAAVMSAWDSNFFTEISGVKSRTYSQDASGLTIGTGNDPSSFRTEQFYLGWNSGSLFKAFDKGAFTVKLGKFDYLIGSGLLIADGEQDGAERGGWWLGPRSTFEDAALVSFDTGPWLVEAFRLRNHTRRENTEGRINGMNFEYDLSTFNLDFGVSYIAVEDSGSSSFKTFDAWSFRADWAPLKALSISGEFIDQDKNDLDAQGWYIKGAYQFRDVMWRPEVSYRYSAFDGDDLDSEDDEGFRSIAYGQTDWGTWYQGEISGNYPLDNSNLKTHMLRLQTFPIDNLKINLLYYNFTLDEEQLFGTELNDDDFGDEVNLTVDWKINNNLDFSGVLGWMAPGDAAKEWAGKGKDWIYSSLYVSYKF